MKWCVLTDRDEYRLFNSHAEFDIEEKLFRSIRISTSGVDEQTVRTADGETYASLSTTGTMARKAVIGTRKATNGWTWWQFQDPETGKLLEMDVLLQKYLKKSR